jgi:hypothetical protein
VANKKNLKPQAHSLTVDEASKGGKASGEARRKTASIKKYLQAALDGKYNDNGETLTGSELLVKNLMSIAFNKSDKDQLAAIKYIFALLGEDRTEEEIEKIKAETNLIKKKIDVVSAEQWSDCDTI